MRGRVNTGEGVALNANTADKILASGQVTAGDFVQYYEELDEIEQSQLNTPCFSMGDYFVTSKSNAICLFKNGQQVDAYSDYTINAVTDYENYIVFFNFTDRLVGVLEIHEGRLRLVDSLTVQDINYNYDDATLIAAGNGTVMVLCQYNYSRYYYRYYAVLDISDNGMLSNPSTNKYETYEGRTNSIEYTNGGFYATRGDSNIGLLSLTVDADRKVIETSTGTTISYVTLGRKIYKNNNLLVYNGFYISSNQYTYYLVVVNAPGTITKIEVNGMASDIIDGIFAAQKRDYPDFYLYSFNPTTVEVALLDSEVFTDLRPASLSCIFTLDDKLYVQKSYSEYDLLLFDIVNDSYIERKTDKNKVVPFAQYGHPIGVAKTNGNAGDTIPVYIPTPSA